MAIRMMAGGVIIKGMIREMNGEAVKKEEG